MDSTQANNRKAWNRVGIGVILICLSLVALGVVPVGTTYPAIHFSTNNGVVFLGVSNAATTLTFTNKINFAADIGLVSNKNFRIEAGSTFTNNAETVMSNATVRGDWTVAPLYASFTSLTNNDYSVTNASYLCITNTTQTNICFSGFAAGRPGQMLVLDNLTTTPMVLIHQSASSSASSRIDLLGIGVATNTVGMGTAGLIYNVISNNWRLLYIAY